MNKEEKISQLVKEGYDKISDHFSQTRYRPWSEFALFKQYIREGQKILDLGCGNGRWYQFLKEQGIRVDYYGLDISEKLLKIAKEKYPEVGAKFTAGEITSLPYPDNQFAAVICNATFHHLPTKSLRRRSLAEMHRVLKPGGNLLMTNWSLWHWPFLKYFFNQWQAKISWKDFFIPWKSPDGKTQCQRYYHAFSNRELKLLLRKSGFNINRSSIYKKRRGQKGVNVVTIATK